MLIGAILFKFMLCYFDFLLHLENLEMAVLFD